MQRTRQGNKGGASNQNCFFLEKKSLKHDCLSQNFKEKEEEIQLLVEKGEEEEKEKKKNYKKSSNYNNNFTSSSAGVGRGRSTSRKEGGGEGREGGETTKKKTSSFFFYCFFCPFICIFSVIKYAAYTPLYYICILLYKVSVIIKVRMTDICRKIICRKVNLFQERKIFLLPFPLNEIEKNKNKKLKNKDNNCNSSNGDEDGENIITCESDEHLGNLNNISSIRNKDLSLNIEESKGRFSSCMKQKRQSLKEQNSSSNGNDETSLSSSSSSCLEECKHKYENGMHMYEMTSFDECDEEEGEEEEEEEEEEKEEEEEEEEEDTLSAERNEDKKEDDFEMADIEGNYNKNNYHGEENDSSKVTVNCAQSEDLKEREICIKKEETEKSDYSVRKIRKKKEKNKTKRKEEKKARKCVILYYICCILSLGILRTRFFRSYCEDKLEKGKKKKGKKKEINLKECDKYIRSISLPLNKEGSFPANTVCNQRYTLLTFLPHVLYDQFKFFFNLFFLMVGLCQLVPILRVGLLITYFLPLTFVLTVTIIKEACDDYKRYKRDKEVNNQMYLRLTPYGTIHIPSSQIKIGDVIIVSANQRVPADLLFLRTSDKSGSTFIKTDQLDGETDWKLRRAVHTLQSLPKKEDIFKLHIECYVEKPKKDIYEFIGNFGVLNSYSFSDNRLQEEKHNNNRSMMSIANAGSTNNNDISSSCSSSSSSSLCNTIGQPSFSSFAPSSSSSTIQHNNVSKNKNVYNNDNEDNDDGSLYGSSSLIEIPLNSFGSFNAKVNNGEGYGSYDDNNNNYYYNNYTTSLPFSSPAPRTALSPPAPQLLSVTSAHSHILSDTNYSNNNARIQTNEEEDHDTNICDGDSKNALDSFNQQRNLHGDKYEHCVHTHKQPKMKRRKQVMADDVNAYSSSSTAPPLSITSPSYHVKEEEGKEKAKYKGKRNAQKYTVLSSTPCYADGSNDVDDKNIKYLSKKNKMEVDEGMIGGGGGRTEGQIERAGSTLSFSNNSPNNNNSKCTYSESLSLENTIWANTVVTSGNVVGLVIYTGRETRSAMNTSQSSTKVGKLDLEINIFSKILCCILVTLALTLATMKAAIFSGMWLIIFFRHILLLSSIIPISMRVNLDMAKTFHSALIMRDWRIPGTVVRTSTIPEELGRIEYLLTDKTGTLTQNEMAFKKMHLGFKCYTDDDICDLQNCIKACFPPLNSSSSSFMVSKKANSNNSNVSCNILINGEEEGEEREGGKIANSAVSSSSQVSIVGISPSPSPHLHNNSLSHSVVSPSSSLLQPNIPSENSFSFPPNGAQKQSNSYYLSSSFSSLPVPVNMTCTPPASPPFYSPLSGEGEDKVKGKERERKVRSLPSSPSPPFSSSAFLYANQSTIGGGGSNTSTTTVTSDTNSNNNNRMLSSFSSASASIPFSSSSFSGLPSGVRRKEDLYTIQMTFLAFSLCHNVSTLKDEHTGEITFQAASPDEIALVKIAAKVGIKLIYRDQYYIHIQNSYGDILRYEIIACFPFTSESKRMGIVVREVTSGNNSSNNSTYVHNNNNIYCNNKVYFFTKGADFVMQSMLKSRMSSWLPEECGNFGREGLRTLVIAMKEMNVHDSLYTHFISTYNQSITFLKKDTINSAVRILEKNLDLLALTGVEDKLQEGVKMTLEKLQEAQVNIWMLTGDKVETAICIAISAGLKSRLHNLYIINSADIENSNKHNKNNMFIDTTQYAMQKLHEFERDARRSVLVIDGKILHIYLSVCPVTFVKVAGLAPSVVCCRCSPTQKAEVVKIIHTVTNKRTCAIGDGGNDVSMIQAANVGVGIVGKEGRQASLAADFSINQFSFLLRLLLLHGRNAYQRSARLSQFVIHRGMIIAIMQVLFSAIFYYIPIAIFQGWLAVGYGTYYTMAPVFALIFDSDLPEKTVFEYPMLYASLRNGRILSLKTFFIWVWQSVYQGSVIMVLAILLFKDKFMNIVSICFTSLILSELLNVLLEVHTCHPLMIAAQIVTVHVYIFSMFILNKYFDIYFIMSTQFCQKVAFMVCISWLPIFMIREIRRFLSPPQHMKLYGDDEEAGGGRRGRGRRLVGGRGGSGGEGIWRMGGNATLRKFSEKFAYANSSSKYDQLPTQI